MTAPARLPRFPREVELLLPGEREMATIVYTHGACTAAEVTARLSSEVSNAYVRSVLNRLVAKGILKRSLSLRTFIYLPALSCTDSGRLALQRFADDHFDGSIERAAAAMKTLVRPRK